MNVYQTKIHDTEETKMEIFALIERTKTDILWQNNKLIVGAILSILLVGGLTTRWMSCELNKLTKQNEIMLQKIRVLENKVLENEEKAAELAAIADLENKKIF